jgi:hypothetical protein
MTQIGAVSKSATNVLTATDPNDFIFKSDLNTFKIISEGTLLSQTVNSNPKTFSVYHGLGYVPNFYAFCKFPDGKVALAGPHSYPYDRDTVSFFNGPHFTPEANSSYLYFILTRPGSNYDVDIKYYIFEAEL